MSSSSSSSSNRELPALLAVARPFLRGELELIDPSLPSLIAVLRSVGAGECWHKHGSFLDHLTDLHRILTLWGSPSPLLPLTGLFHSAYSNSYVNLAIFPPTPTSRDRLRLLIGPQPERLVHLFCVVPRQPLIHDDLLFRYSSDAQLSLHLSLSHTHTDPNSPWRRKLNSLLPPSGVTVKHIRTGEDVAVSRRVVAAFLLMTMADFSDQLFGFQDSLFGGNQDGRLEFKGNNVKATLWPGDGKPGLWMNAVSRMGAVYRLIVREEELYSEEQHNNNNKGNGDDRDEDIELVIPPVFEGCSKVLGTKEQIEARDMYWEAVCSGGGEGVEGLLVGSCERNPYVGEPHLVLGQVYLGEGRYEEAAREAEEGLRLVVEWGSSWDKRMSWEGWVAWGRVLLMKARERSWPDTAWGILNLGLVK